MEPSTHNAVCTACNAQVGAPCTTATETGRRPVAWRHFARMHDAILAAVKA